jgi:hypothetical protein
MTSALTFIKIEKELQPRVHQTNPDSPGEEHNRDIGSEPSVASGDQASSEVPMISGGVSNEPGGGHEQK